MTGTVILKSFLRLGFLCFASHFGNNVIDFLLTDCENYIDDIPHDTLLVPVMRPESIYDSNGEYLDDPLEITSYQILSQIGRGGFSKVYLVRQISNGKIYAMKVISKTFAAKWGGELVKREFELMKEVSSPFVVDLLYVFPTEDTYNFVMEYCPGLSLYQNLVIQKKFTVKNSLIYFAEMLLVVNYLHSKGILFRDLKVRAISNRPGRKFSS